MQRLITDRTQQNVARRAELSRKGWANMTVAERNEWTGSPMDVIGANLLPPGPYYSSSVNTTFLNDEIIATATVSGAWLFSILIIGDAADFQNKELTFSAESFTHSASSIPKLELYWHSDTTGGSYAGGSLFDAGSVVVDTTDWPNTENRPKLALYIYVSASEGIAAGTQSKFGKVMLEVGDARHAYVPYSEVVPTAATKGAYNYSDLNRVERAVAEISALANLGLTTKTDWTMWDVPRVSDMQRYLSNIVRIRTFCGSSIELPATMDKLDYIDANNIEKILMAAYEVV